MMVVEAQITKSAPTFGGGDAETWEWHEQSMARQELADRLLSNRRHILVGILPTGISSEPFDQIVRELDHCRLHATECTSGSAKAGEASREEKDVALALAKTGEAPPIWILGCYLTR
jgi:hypothetical protein